MISWLVSNLATILISLCLAGLVIGIVVKMVCDKKKGKGSCGCGCQSCAMKGTCHNSKK